MTDKTPLEQSGLDLLFNNARTYNNWQDKPVSDDTLHALFDLVRMGPTSANCSPARIVFVKSDAAKEKLKACLAEGNVAKTMAAPVCAIIAHDMEFHEHLPKLFPHTDAKSWFAGKPDFIESTAFRNGTLQGGYLIMAARALGLDCGPMSGFDNEAVDKAFFASTTYKSNFLCNLGYGDDKDMFPRSPRFDFDEACRID
ncbi:MAG TPA: malonic semialdehyde reductase [Rhodospirillaceae bacterium]|nr:malonic semialdehyde reductase [Alphaproteobacteria bacterium]OUT41026.1 MAG: malonic semialdehyde reductase [Micavibrio sp. TMED2]HCI46004.1 malonic semialdehyde reductase [Rhodospirillaceae bacterium]MAS47478.1 malonic semialdehyde reductase [Alphaproteobacteria bacterium]MAX96650.1 malonic semialdehyde reductase [Alphaproteobacteria bacterium]|tara:strand:- start:2222 stop:2818 length:597 start_codon:yes stop_codon:yes gene_type:complete